MTRFASTTIASALSAALLLGCGDKQNPAGDYGGGGGAGGSTSTGVSYAQTIAPMMAQSCTLSGCHGGSSPVMGIGLDTYDKVVANAGAASSAIQSNSMPLDPGVALTDTDKQNFQDWVNAGMPNN